MKQLSDRPGVLCEVDDRVAWVTLNRPEVRNAVNTAMLESLIETFDEINDTPEIWCVILKGAGGGFCAGADQKERPNMTADAVRRRRRLAPAAFSAMRDCVRPVIAQVHGHALGSGLELALGCDLVVVARGTTMGLIETTLGATPGGGGTQLLPRLIGLQRAKELILTGRRFTSDEAEAWGMFNYVVSPEELEEATLRLAGEIVAAAPIAVAQSKRAINMSLDVTYGLGLQVEEALYERTLTSSDRSEALQAYREKRPARFRGE